MPLLRKREKSPSEVKKEEEGKADQTKLWNPLFERYPIGTWPIHIKL